MNTRGTVPRSVQNTHRHRSVLEDAYGEVSDKPPEYAELTMPPDIRETTDPTAPQPGNSTPVKILLRPAAYVQHLLVHLRPIEAMVQDYERAMALRTEALKRFPHGLIAPRHRQQKGHHNSITAS